MYFSNAKAGDKVWDYVYGEGVITGVFKRNIHILFEDSKNDRIMKKTGIRKSHSHNQRLFYYDSRPIVITQDDLDIHDGCGTLEIKTTITQRYENGHFDEETYSQRIHRSIRKPQTRDTGRNKQICGIGYVLSSNRVCPQCGKEFYIPMDDKDKQIETLKRTVKLLSARIERLERKVK